LLVVFSRLSNFSAILPLEQFFSYPAKGQELRRLHCGIVVGVKEMFRVLLLKYKVKRLFLLGKKDPKNCLC
jgi:hypothetical protein